jgi:thiol-disulfide isomerase/thioredoxin
MKPPHEAEPAPPTPRRSTRATPRALKWLRLVAVAGLAGFALVSMLLQHRQQWLGGTTGAPVRIMAPSKRVLAPEIQLRTVSGVPFQLSALRGHVVLIDFWATWCSPCREEVPSLVAIQQEYEPKGVRLVGISMDDEASVVRTFQAATHINYPVAMADAELADRFGGIMGLPLKFLVDRRGRIAARVQGAVSITSLRTALEQLARE